jgi:pimeloyl-ACP methyl ester carboxylesterase
VSYGTRLALTAMRDLKAPIRSVILDGVYPPQVDAWDEEAGNGYAAFQVIFKSCAAQPDCNAAYPDLETVFVDAVTDLDANPLPLQDEDGNETDETLTGQQLVDDLYMALYDSTMIRYLPTKIYAANERDAYIYSFPWWDDDQLENIEYPAGVDLKTLSEDEYNSLWASYLGYSTTDELLTYLDTLSADDYASQQANFEDAATDSNGALIDSDSEGFFNTVECYEEVPFNSLERAKVLLNGVPQNIQSALLEDFLTQVSECDLWNLPQATDFENKAVTSNLPVLVMSGEFDPITPAKWAQATADALPNSFNFVIPGMGHATVDIGNDCATQIALDFLDDPLSEPDASCIARMAPEFYIGNR